MTITKEHFDQFKEDLDKQLVQIDKKLDLVVNPRTGVFAELREINTKANRAHERIDGLEKDHKSLKQVVQGKDGEHGLDYDVFVLKKSQSRRIKIMDWVMRSLIVGMVGLFAYIGKFVLENIDGVQRLIELIKRIP